MLGVPASKITVHLLGVDENFKPLSPEKLQIYRQQLNLPETILLFVGTFEPRKNILGLLEAYRLLLEQMPDAPPLVVAGQRGWLFDETMQQIEQMKLAQRVLWRENVSQEALPALYNLAAALILASFYEGFGFPPLEAMACGTVPIVSNRSSLPEVVGDVGALIDPDNPADIAAAVHRALTDSEWLKTNRAAGLERAAAFKWANTARIALSAYHALL
jgi:glycosyltransferase involved in cell wall biosynthesis